MLPVVTAVGLLTGGLLSGAVLTETVFAFSGIGSFIRTAIDGRDYPVLMGFIMIIAMVYVLMNLLVDLSYSLIDPRVRVHDDAADQQSREDRPARRADREHASERGASLWREAFRRLRPARWRSSARSILAAVRPGRHRRPVPRAATAPPRRTGAARSSPTRAIHRPARRALARPRPPGPRRVQPDVVGARQTLLVGVVSTLFGLVIGCLDRRPRRRRRSASAASVGRRIDTVLMRFIDMLLAMPSLLLAVTIAAMLGPA